MRKIYDLSFKIIYSFYLNYFKWNLIFTNFFYLINIIILSIIFNINLQLVSLLVLPYNWLVSIINNL